MKAGKLTRIAKEISIENIFEWICELLAEDSTKRLEEDVKFVFKLAFKHLKTEFARYCCDSKSDVDNEDAFYRFYFGEISDDWKISLSEFYDPLNRKNAHRTLSNEYINRLMTSERFKTHLREYLASESLLSEYRNNVPKKIFKILKRFDKLIIMNDVENNKKIINIARQYFRYNRQCKLPWTDKEVKSAMKKISLFCK